MIFPAPLPPSFHPGAPADPPYIPRHRDYVLLLAPGSLLVTGSARVSSRQPRPDGTTGVRVTGMTGAVSYRRLPASRLVLHPLSDFWNGRSTTDPGTDTEEALTAPVTGSPFSRPFPSA